MTVAEMSVADLPVLAALKSKLKWHQARQRLLAENVANADTPGYKARDLEAPSFATLVERHTTVRTTAIQTTHASHIAAAPPGRAGEAFAPTTGAAWETRPSGNSVSLEEQMMKVTANQADYQAASSLYSRSLALLRIALGQGGA